ncbi:SDR family NAD(P)-dependent oxidoreductase [Nocardiopsis mangrovi]|uniref:SDR family NAD(P)-dependent oxidoreductase n=1 Tax=Nocardiopsis mangrovi TaxID=1179818 RepID=A0ABV9DTL8_9ACTN
MAMTDTTVLITGATDGLGRHTANRLAGLGARLILHGRDPERAARVREEIEAAGGTADVVLADLADLRAVDRLADDVLASHSRLDVLVNNAGVGFGRPGAGREESADGIELRFAVNHLAGLLLTRRLRPLLAGSAPARVINVASIGQEAIDFADPMFHEGYDGVAAYRRSKLAQIMSTFDLAAEFAPDRITVTALHPATLMDTTMVGDAQREPRSSVAEGGDALLRLVTAPETEIGTGRYYDGRQESRAHPLAYDPDARARLRDLSAELIAGALGRPA